MFRQIKLPCNAKKASRKTEAFLFLFRLTDFKIFQHLSNKIKYESWSIKKKSIHLAIQKINLKLKLI